MIGRHWTKTSSVYGKIRAKFGLKTPGPNASDSEGFRRDRRPISGHALRPLPWHGGRRLSLHARRPPDGAPSRTTLRASGWASSVANKFGQRQNLSSGSDPGQPGAMIDAAMNGKWPSAPVRCRTWRTSSPSMPTPSPRSRRTSPGDPVRLCTAVCDGVQWVRTLRQSIEDCPEGSVVREILDGHKKHGDGPSPPRPAWTAMLCRSGSPPNNGSRPSQ